MKPKNKRKQKQQVSKAAQQSTAQNEPKSRRDVLLKIGQYAAGVAVLGVGGMWTVRSVEAHGFERDLSRMGQGKPSVVQIHDPGCPICTALQRQARKALREIGEDEMVYLVADITTDEGAAFASKYGAAHVTLLLFDENGELKNTLQGMRYADELAQSFVAHKGRPKSVTN